MALPLQSGKRSSIGSVAIIRLSPQDVTLAIDVGTATTVPTMIAIVADMAKQRIMAGLSSEMTCADTVEETRNNKQMKVKIQSSCSS